MKLVTKHALFVFCVLPLLVVIAGLVAIGGVCVKFITNVVSLWELH